MESSLSPRKMPLVRFQCRGVGMRIDNRRGRRLEHVERCPPTRMRAVDQHADPLHFGDQLQAEPRQACVGAFVAAVADMVLLVVGHESMAHAEPVEDLDQTDIAVKGCRSLEVEADRQLALGLRRYGVLRAFEKKEFVVAFADEAAPLRNAPDRTQRVVRIGRNGDRRHGVAAAAHALQRVQMRRPTSAGRRRGESLVPYDSRSVEPLRP